MKSTNTYKILVAGGLALAVSACGGKDPYRHFDGANSHVAQNGYLVNSNAFCDKNDNGQYDEGEAFAVTGENGEFNLACDSVIVVKEGNNKLDEDTYVPFTRTLKAPGSSKMVTPVTTLVSELVNKHGFSVEDAEKQVKAFLGLPDGVSVFKQDPLAEAKAGNLQLAKATATVSQIVIELSRQYGETGEGDEEAQANVLEALANAAKDSKTLISDEKVDVDVLSDVVDAVSENSGDAGAVKQALGKKLNEALKLKTYKDIVEKKKIEQGSDNPKLKDANGDDIKSVSEAKYAVLVDNKFTIVRENVNTIVTIGGKKKADSNSGKIKSIEATLKREGGYQISGKTVQAGLRVKGNDATLEIITKLEVTGNDSEAKVKAEDYATRVYYSNKGDSIDVSLKDISKEADTTVGGNGVFSIVEISGDEYALSIDYAALLDALASREDQILGDDRVVGEVGVDYQEMIEKLRHLKSGEYEVNLVFKGLNIRKANADSLPVAEASFKNDETLKFNGSSISAIVEL